MAETETKNGPLGLMLAIVFVIALIMGPGIGTYLINPDPSSADSVYTFLGMPIIYAWSLVWYAIMVTVVVTAYVAVWDKDEEEPTE
jgi:hypothetical protein